MISQTVCMKGACSAKPRYRASVLPFFEAVAARRDQDKEHDTPQPHLPTHSPL